MTEARAALQSGLAAHRQGDLAAAADAYQRAIDLNDDADAWHMLGMLRHQGGDARAALLCLERALQQRPIDPVMLANRAAVHLALGDFAHSEIDAARAAMARPDLYAAWINLGLALEGQSRQDEALPALERAQALRPGVATASAILRCIFAIARRYSIGGRPSAAERLWVRYFALGGDSADAWLLRANVAGDLGQHEESLRYHAEARRRAPESSDHASAELIAICHHSATDVRAMAERAADWSQRYCAGIEPDALPLQHAYPQRIGFYSPRFTAGPMASLVLPLLQQLRVRGIEVYLYAGFDHVDEDTPRFRAVASAWRDCHGYADAALVLQARRDRLDVMVDLCGHAPGNRLRAFAQRMAPLQLSWGDWFATTGVAAIDVFFGDPVLTPADEDDCYAERVARLPHSRFVYAPPASARATNLQPRADTPGICFVSLNRIAKLTDATLACWARILHAVPGSELQLRSAALDEPETAARLRERFAAQGIDGARILCAGFAGYAEVLADYARADIALDPFPFNGCVTTLDALWMGVPVVALKGHSLVARQGAALLTAHGFASWAAASAADYAAIAVRLAHSLSERQSARTALLAKRETSILFDVVRFADDWIGALAAAASH